MRKSFLRMLVLSLIVQVALVSCSDEFNNHKGDSLIFNYNGKQYGFGSNLEINSLVNPIASGPLQGKIGWQVSNALYINLPDIFEVDGILLLSNRNECNFFSPIEDNIDSLLNCRFPKLLDSTKVYFFKSGFLGIGYKNCETKELSYKNCETKELWDFIMGKPIKRKVCDQIGTFELELSNSENKVIQITNGNYKVAGVIR